MKTIIVPDLHDRVRQTIEKKRQRLLQYDDNGDLTTDFYGFEVFEFLIFLELRDADGNAVLHYPIAIGHETILEDLMREQLAIYSRLLPGYTIAVIAIENTLVNWEEWDLLFAYPTAEALVNANFENLERKLIPSKKQVSDCFCCRKKENAKQFSDTEMAQEQMTEVTRFSKNEDCEPMPLVIAHRHHF